MPNNCLPVLSSIWSSKSDNYLCFTKMASECCNRRKSMRTWEHKWWTGDTQRSQALAERICWSLRGGSWRHVLNLRGPTTSPCQTGVWCESTSTRNWSTCLFGVQTLVFGWTTQDDTCGSKEAIGPWYVSYVWTVAPPMLEDEMAWYANLEKKTLRIEL